MNVLFVCTGNTCRSPMAAALLQKKTDKHTVRSAGLLAPVPMAASDNAVRAMQEMGLDIANHTATQITKETVDWADIILTMTQGHAKAVQTIFPDAAGKTHALRVYAGEEGDVEDPFGGDFATYLHTAQELERLLAAAPL